MISFYRLTTVVLIPISCSWFSIASSVLSSVMISSNSVMLHICESERTLNFVWSSSRYFLSAQESMIRRR